MVTGLYNKTGTFLSGLALPILLYHSVDDHPPVALTKNVHNVGTENFYQQVCWLKKNYDIVFVDQLFAPNCDFRGKAAITFDDAYSSIFQNALPLLIEMKIPSTVFLNGQTLQNEIFWRDKIRYIMINGYINDFIALADTAVSKFGINASNFYSKTKHPTVPSSLIDQLCNAFFTSKGITLNDVSYCLNDASQLIINDYLSYGNHTLQHYLLSSLSNEEQIHQIEQNQKILKSLPGQKSNIFSIPFGGRNSINKATLDIMSNLHFSGVLSAQGRFNSNKVENQFMASLKILDRYMPPNSFKIFIKTFNKRLVKTFLKRETPSFMLENMTSNNIENWNQ